MLFSFEAVTGETINVSLLQTVFLAQLVLFTALIVVVVWKVSRVAGLEPRSRKKRYYQINRVLYSALPETKIVHRDDEFSREDILAMFDDAETDTTREGALPYLYRRLKQVQWRIEASPVRGLFTAGVLTAVAWFATRSDEWLRSSVAFDAFTARSPSELASAFAGVLSGLGTVGEILMVVFVMLYQFWQFTAAMLVLAAIAAYYIQQNSQNDTISRWTTRYLYFWQALAVLLTVIYLVQAIALGKPFVVINAAIDAGAASQAILALLAVVLLYTFFSVIRGGLFYLFNAVTSMVTYQAFRAGVWLKGTTLAAVVVAAVVAASFGTSLPVTVSVAVGAIVVFRFIGWMSRRIELAVTNVPMPRPPRRRVLVAADVLPSEAIEDLEDDIYIVSIGGKRLAHRSKDSVADTTVEGLNDIFGRNGERRGWSPKREEYIYRELVKRATVDVAEIIRELDAEITGRIESSLKDNDGSASSKAMLRELYEEYPERDVRRAVRELRRYGRIRLRPGEIELLDRDSLTK